MLEQSTNTLNTRKTQQVCYHWSYVVMRNNQEIIMLQYAIVEITEMKMFNVDHGLHDFKVLAASMAVLIRDEWNYCKVPTKATCSNLVNVLG